MWSLHRGSVDARIYQGLFYVSLLGHLSEVPVVPFWFPYSFLGFFLLWLVPESCPRTQNSLQGFTLALLTALLYSLWVPRYNSQWGGTFWREDVLSFLLMFSGLSNPFLFWILWEARIKGPFGRSSRFWTPVWFSFPSTSLLNLFQFLLPAFRGIFCGSWGVSIRYRMYPWSGSKGSSDTF